MIHLTRGLIRRWLDQLLHIDDTPARTAAAFAFGVFIGFSPFLGLHTILGVVFAFLLNYNRIAVLLGIYSNLPFVVAPYYAFATVAGAMVTGDRVPPGFGTQLGRLFEHSFLDVEFWRQLVTLLTPLVVPFAVGSLIGAALLAAAAYPIALAFVTSRRRIKRLIHHPRDARPRHRRRNAN